MSYKQIDKATRFRYPEDLYQAIKPHGYFFISEFIYEKYQEGLSARDIGRILDVSKSCIITWMQNWGFTRRPLGGNNRNPEIKKVAVRQRIKQYRGKMKAGKVAKLFNCGRTTVINIWKDES